jgi:hypothetical protein
MLFAVRLCGDDQDDRHGDLAFGRSAMSDSLLVARALLMDARATQTRFHEWNDAEIAAFEARRRRHAVYWRPFGSLFGGRGAPAESPDP